MSVERSSKVALGHEIHLESAVAGLFLEQALGRGFVELRLDNWPSVVPSLAVLGAPVFHFEAERRETALYEWDGALVLVGRHGNQVHAAVAAGSAKTVEELFAKLREQLPAPDPSSKHEVTVTFWTYGRHGPQQSWRSISVPEWDEITPNYSAATQSSLQALMRGFTPAHGGQLILWRGEAGTGKTFALRALAWEWRGWCEFHYIVDPDSFFGEHADYLMSVLMEEGSEIAHMQRAMRSAAAGFSVGSFTLMSEDEDDAEDGAGRAWRVLVLEDTGELLSANARAAVGQGLSRFLNVVDGLIGQGLRVLVLVTTNEELKALHPAVARPGRAAANVEFSPLSSAEAGAWLASHGISEADAQPATLASLYARAEGRDPAEVILAQFEEGSDAGPRER
jgi:hypothetical protein